jgi:hypothetical protein
MGAKSSTMPLKTMGESTSFSTKRTAVLVNLPDHGYDLISFISLT